MMLDSIVNHFFKHEDYISIINDQHVNNIVSRYNDLLYENTTCLDTNKHYLLLMPCAASWSNLTFESFHAIHHFGRPNDCNDNTLALIEHQFTGYYHVIETCGYNMAISNDMNTVEFKRHTASNPYHEQFSSPISINCLLILLRQKLVLKLLNQLYQNTYQWLSDRQIHNVPATEITAVSKKLARLKAFIISCFAIVDNCIDRMSTDAHSSEDYIQIINNEYTLQQYMSNQVDDLLILNGGYGFMQQSPQAKLWRQIDQLMLFNISPAWLLNQILSHQLLI